MCMLGGNTNVFSRVQHVPSNVMSLDRQGSTQRICGW